MAAAPGPTSCSSGIAPVSKLPAQAKSPVRFGSQTQASSWQKPSALQASKTKVRQCAENHHRGMHATTLCTAFFERSDVFA